MSSLVLGRGNDPFDNLNDIIELNEISDDDKTETIKAAMFFLVGNDRRDSNRNILYRKTLQAALGRLRDSGVQIGLHASHDAGDDPSVMREEIQILSDISRRDIIMNRHHFLKWREVEHGIKIAQSGITWDYTMGYPDVTGFRLGVSHPVPLFNLVGLELFAIEEHPLIIMDRTLERQKFLGLGEEEAFELCLLSLQQTRKHDGAFVMLWHNNTLINSKDNCD